MLDMLLTPDQLVDGPRRVTMTARPQRVAFLIDPADPALALAAIESACFTWAGKRQILIPCLADDRPDDIWSKILEKHDPDVILDLIGADETFVNEQTNTRSRQVERWERPTETIEIIGATVFAGLQRWKRMRSTGTSRIAINLHPLDSNPLALPLAFRLGHLNPRPMDRHMLIERSYRAHEMGDFIDLRQVDPRDLGVAECRRLATEVPLDLHDLVWPNLPSGMTDYFTPIGLTTIGLPSQEPSYAFGGPPNPEREQSDEAYFSRLVVVGSPSSIEDLCLAWNLRAQRPGLQFFPQWINPEWISSHDVAQSLHWGLNWENSGLSEFGRRPPLHLLSATLSHKELAELADGLPDFGTPVVAHDRASLDRFFARGLRLGIEQPSVANFRQGRADIAVPDYMELGDWQFAERIGWTVKIEGYAPPRVARRFIPWHGPSLVRLAVDGFAGSINVPDIQPGELWTMTTNSGWDQVAAVSEEAGYSAQISDKGQPAIAVLRLIAGESGLRLLASSRVYRLIDAMSETVERQAIQQAVRRGLERIAIENLAEQQEADFVNFLFRDVTSGAQFDRQHYTWSQIRNALGADIPRDAFDPLIEWLVEHRVLFQGYKFQCTNCGVARWYSINRLSVIQNCEGCGHQSAKPISTNQLTWRYRLNETIAQAVDQGIMPHLLAVNRMLAWRREIDTPLFGVLPGVKLIPRDGEDAEEIEVDLFAIKGGRIIIGECKRGGDRITDRVVDRFAATARRFNCSRIIFATAGHTDDDEQALRRAREVSAPAFIETWDRTALFDGPSVGIQADPVEYLQQIVGML